MYRTYAIYFHDNGKLYIGYTKKAIEERLNEHIRRPRGILKWAIPKYTHSLYLMGEFEYKADALSHEVELIKRYNTTDRRNGYNLTKGGESPPIDWDGKQWMIGKSEEEIKTINKKKSRPGQSNPFYGKAHNPESTKKMVESRRTNGSYDKSPSSIGIIYNNIEYETKLDMRKALSISRAKQEKLIKEGKAMLKAQINSKEVS